MSLLIDLTLMKIKVLYF